MKILYTSDLHLSHKLVSELRGFSSIEEHDRKIAENWKATVGPKDTVWILGDLSMDPYGGDNPPLEQIAKLPGKKHLISGNHCPTHPMHRDYHKHMERHLKVFETVSPFARRKFGGNDVLLSHFPYNSDRGSEIRYQQWRLPDMGGWLLHGHTHLKNRGRGKEIHVGLDAWDLKPVPQDVIISIMNDRKAEVNA